MKPEPDKYHRLLENLPDAFAYHQIVNDNDGYRNHDCAQNSLTRPH